MNAQITIPANAKQFTKESTMIYDYNPEKTYNLIAAGKLRPDSWEEHTNAVRIWVLVCMEGQDPEEFVPSEYDEIDCNLVVNDFGNQQYTMIVKDDDGNYSAIALEEQ